MLTCNIATFKSFNGDRVEVNTMKRYLIDIHCRREETWNIQTHRLNIQSYIVPFTLPSRETCMILIEKEIL
jgi:hypothetical protein